MVGALVCGESVGFDDAFVGKFVGIGVRKKEGLDEGPGSTNIGVIVGIDVG